MILLPKIPKLRLTVATAATALLACGWPITMLWVIGWQHLHCQKLPDISSTHRTNWSSTDQEIYALLHPPPYPGLRGLGLLPEHNLALCLSLLHLPVATTQDEFENILYERLARLRAKGPPDNMSEAQLILSMAEPIDQDLLKTRLYFLDQSLWNIRATDVQFAHDSTEWKSPFGLIAEERLAFKTRAKLIDDLTFNLL